VATLPICAYGGASCFAGPADEVTAHEQEVHGRKKGGKNKPKRESLLATKPSLSEADQVEIQRMYRKLAGHRARPRKLR
jgi:hypothetical protein